MKILVAETDREFASELRRHFAEAGWTAVVATSSMDAWDLLAADRPDLLVTRVLFGIGRVPGTALGARARSIKIPVIYVPATAERALHVTEDHGAVLVKPVDPRDVLAVAGRLLSEEAGDKQTSTSAVIPVGSVSASGGGSY